MTLTRSWFRGLFVLYAVTSLTSLLLGEGNVSPALKLAYETEPNPWMDEHPWLMLALFIPYLTVIVAGMVGMVRFRSWGRSVSFWSTVVGFSLYPFLGADLSSSWGMAFGQAGEMLWGALLALAYLSPLSREFTDAPRTACAIGPLPSPEDIRA
jgi:hypothetical protein